MGVYKKLYLLNLLFCLILSSISFSQTTDLDFDQVLVNGAAPPYEFCQGEIPTFELRFRLKVGSATLSLTTTNTLNLKAIGSGANTFTTTITGITTTGDGGSTITSSGSEYYTWPIVGAKAIQLSNDGLTNVIFSITLSSTQYTDPDSPDSAVSATIPINVKSKPPAVSLSTSNGAFDGGNNISICSGNDLIIYADTGYTHYEFFRKVNGLAVFNSLGVSNSSSITLTNINAAGEQIKVRTYNGLDCYQDSLTHSIK